MPEEVEDDYGAPETPDIVETTDFVEIDAEPVNQLVPEDAATKKEVTAALLRYIDRDTLSARLTTGQMEAFEDIFADDGLFLPSQRQRQGRRHDGGQGQHAVFGRFEQGHCPV